LYSPISRTCSDCVLLSTFLGPSLPPANLTQSHHYPIHLNPEGRGSMFL
jgi:hypothetical protein